MCKVKWWHRFPTEQSTCVTFFEWKDVIGTYVGEPFSSNQIKKPLLWGSGAFVWDKLNPFPSIGTLTKTTVSYCICWSSGFEFVGRNWVLGVGKYFRFLSFGWVVGVLFPFSGENPVWWLRLHSSCTITWKWKMTGNVLGRERERRFHWIFLGKWKSRGEIHPEETWQKKTISGQGLAFERENNEVLCFSLAKVMYFRMVMFS